MMNKMITADFEKQLQQEIYNRRGYSKYENVKGKVTLCLSCNKVEISKNGDRTCRFCGYFPNAYWLTKEKFFYYLSLYGLKDIEIVDMQLVDEVVEYFS